MKLTNAEKQKAYRDRKRGSAPRELSPCGTRNAAERHRYNDEPLCQECMEAEREYMRDRQRERYQQAKNDSK